MKRNLGFDLLKTLCAFLIICIHTPFKGLLGEIVTPLTRIAVPIFFMISGYYYSLTKKHQAQKKQLYKIFRLFVFANIIYLCWNLLFHFFKNDLSAYIGKTFTVKAVFNFVVFNESPLRSHLWYLGAILYVLLIIFLFELKWDRKKLYPLIPILLLLDLVFGKYSILIFSAEFPYIYVRNFLCVGLPYFLIGDMLYARPIKIKQKSAFLLSLIFAVTTLGEKFLLVFLKANATRDHYISSTFLAVCLFLFANNLNVRENKTINALCYIGAKLSTNIYIFHPIIITIMQLALKEISYSPLTTLYRYTSPIIIFIITATLSWMCHITAKKLKREV